MTAARNPLGVFLRMGLVMAAVLAPIGALTWAVRAQARLAEGTLQEISGLTDPSPYRVSLTGHIDKIRLSTASFIQKSDPSLRGQIASIEADFEQSLRQFEQQNPRLLPALARNRILAAYRPFQGSTAEAVELTDRINAERQVWEANYEEALSLVERRLRPLLRRNREAAAARGDALLNLENQWRAWQQNIARHWLQPAPALWNQTLDSEDKCEVFLNVYAQLATFAVEKQVIRAIRPLHEANVSIGRKLVALENRRTHVQRLAGDHRTRLLDTLNQVLPPLPPAELEKRRDTLLHSIHWRMAVMGACVALAVLVLVLGALGMRRIWLGPAEPAYIPPPPAPPENPLFEMDLNGTISRWTAAAQKLYGYAGFEIQGRSVAALFATQDEIDHLRRALGAGELAGFEAVHKGKSGVFIPVRLEFRPLANSGGHLAAIGVVVHRK